MKVDFPDYTKRLQVVATNHVAPAFFNHSVTEAVLKCLLRFGSKDGNGGMLGRVKGRLNSQVNANFQGTLKIDCVLVAARRSLMFENPLFSVKCSDLALSSFGLSFLLLEIKQGTSG